jgi:predicted nucleic acid-binding protein
MGMSRIFWDSNLFIYLLEDYGQLSLATKRLRGEMLDRGDQLLTSALTLGEILVKPLERGDSVRCRKYEDALTKTVLILPFDLRTARRYASIRSNCTAKGPDAMQLACAGEAGVDLFITNDRRLQGKQVDGIQFIVALDQVPI